MGPFRGPIFFNRIAAHVMLGIDSIGCFIIGLQIALCHYYANKAALAAAESQCFMPIVSSKANLCALNHDIIYLIPMVTGIFSPISTT
jgi:hypothetical protein